MGGFDIWQIVYKHITYFPYFYQLPTPMNSMIECSTDLAHIFDLLFYTIDFYNLYLTTITKLVSLFLTVSYY